MPDVETACRGLRPTTGHNGCTMIYIQKWWMHSVYIYINRYIYIYIVCMCGVCVRACVRACVCVCVQYAENSSLGTRIITATVLLYCLFLLQTAVCRTSMICCVNTFILVLTFSCFIRIVSCCACCVISIVRL